MLRELLGNQMILKLGRFSFLSVVSAPEKMSVSISSRVLYDKPSVII